MDSWGGFARGKAWGRLTVSRRGRAPQQEVAIFFGLGEGALVRTNDPIVFNMFINGFCSLQFQNGQKLSFGVGWS